MRWSLEPSPETARSYVAWLDRRASAILAITALLLAGAIYLIATHLPLYSDLSYLLPQDAPAVRGLRELEERVISKDTTFILVEAPDPATRATAAAEVIEAARSLDRDLVDRIDTDDHEIRSYIKAHKFLFVPLVDLIEARRALAQRISDAKIRANPLFIDLDDDPEQRERQAREDKRRLDELRAKRREAEGRLDRSSFVSADQRTQMIMVRTSFNTADVDRARRLLPAIEAIAARVRTAHPTITIGLAGGVPTAVAEYSALVRGIVLSSVITSLLVLLVLWLHLRTWRLVVLLGVNILVATLLSFGVASLTVGHLNAATAFLGAVIAGNGINFGIVLVARYVEERRSHPVETSLATAIARTLRPTLVAALGAAIAYGALTATSFQGFAHFGVISGVGMLVCWLASYVVLPVLLLRFAREPRDRESWFSSVVSVFRVRRPVVACVVAGAISLGAGVITWRYVADDPFEYDLTQLRSEAPDAAAARDWMKVVDSRFGRGLWTRSYILTRRPAQVPHVLEAIEASQRTPIGRATVGEPFSLLDVVPPDQQRKLTALAEIRQLLDDPGLEELAPAERAELRELRPPEELAIVTVADLPDQLRRELTERDGQIGNLVIVRPTEDFDELDGHQLVLLASAMRALDLEDVATSGASLIFADIIHAILRDGPVVTLVSVLGLCVLVLVVVGRNRRAVAVLASTFVGTLVMIAACALIGLKVTFLDYVALPITLGLGVDYAINVAERADRDDPTIALRMTGSSVLVCSLTTIIGYASLLVSSNLAIRGFGLASLIGEITCVVAALTLVPAIVSSRGHVVS